MAITALGVGSGLDLNGLLDQLESAERQRLEPLTLQKQSYQSKISAYGKLEAALSSLQVATENLQGDEVFNSFSTSSSEEIFRAAAGNEAVAGSYTVDVTQLAQTYSIATEGVADKSADLGAADITFTLANGDNLVVSVDANASSLEDIRDAINAVGEGVSASIVNDGGTEPYRLVFSSTDSGTEAAIDSIDFDALAGSLSLDAATEFAAQDAELTVNGIAISSQSNLVEDAIQGVTLTLDAVGTDNLIVARDKQNITQAVKDFVGAYNSLHNVMSGLSRFSAEGSSGVLLGDNALRNIESRLRSTFNSSLPDGELNTFSDIGISVQLDGSLELDEEKLSDLIDSDLASLQQALAGDDADNGLIGRMQDALVLILDDNGFLNRAAEGMEGRIERVNERYLQMEGRVESTMDRYRRQFTQLDLTISQMNATSEYLIQQFDIMNAQLGQKS